MYILKFKSYGDWMAAKANINLNNLFDEQFNNEDNPPDQDALLPNLYPIAAHHKGIWRYFKIVRRKRFTLSIRRPSKAFKICLKFRRGRIVTTQQDPFGADPSIVYYNPMFVSLFIPIGTNAPDYAQGKFDKITTGATVSYTHRVIFKDP
jgi:hypothetical protein